MKFLSHPNFSLFCFLLNCFFGLSALMSGSYIFALICAACAFVCGRSYMIGKSN